MFLSKFNTVSRVLVLYFLSIFILWVYIQFQGTKDSQLNYLFAFSYGLIPLFGGFAGLISFLNLFKQNKDFGLFVLFMSIGLVLWGVGEGIWSYYNLVLTVEVPYPSIADVAFVLTYPFWFMGLVSLTKHVGINISFKNKSIGIAIFAIVIIFLLSLVYLALVLSDIQTSDLVSGDLTTLFDIFYPFWDTFMLVFILIVDSLFSMKETRTASSKKVLAIITIGMIVNFLADSLFSNATVNGVFYNGDFTDLLFATSVFFVSLGTNVINKSDQL